MPVDGSSIHRAWQNHLGDLWSSFSAMIRLSHATNRSTLLSRWTYTDLALKGWEDIGPTLSDIGRVLDDGDRVVVCDQKPTLDLLASDVWNHPVVRTKARWPTNRDPRAVCYQFDGVFNGHLNNPPDDHIEHFRAAFPQAQRLGKPMALADIVHVLSYATIFVGIDSGVSHVAASVGTPMILCRYRGDLRTTHAAQQFTACADLIEAIPLIRSRVAT